MDRTDAQPSRKALLRNTILKGLFLYVLAPAAILWLLARPLGDAVRRAETAVFWILPAALGAVILNWLVYRLIRRKRPSLLSFCFSYSASMENMWRVELYAARRTAISP